MSVDRWGAVDRYLEGLYVEADPALDAALAASAAAGLPPIHVPRMQGKLLRFLVELVDARRILEFGTLGGYSAIWLARGLGPGGSMVTLELNPVYAQVARANLARAALGGVVDVRVGPAKDTLPALEAERRGPFDLIFIDADRPNYPDHFDWALRLSHPGSLIVADNVIREGAVTDPASTDAGVQGVRRFHERVARDPRVRAVALQLVSGKGHDGLALLRVVGHSTR